MNKKLPSIAKYCRHTYLGMSYIRRVNKTIYEKAINYTEANMYTVASFTHNELEYSYDSHLSLYYGTDLNDTMFDKCFNE